MVLDADGLVDEQVRKDVLHPVGHVQDVRHLEVGHTVSHVDEQEVSVFFFFPPLCSN